MLVQVHRAIYAHIMLNISTRVCQVLKGRKAHKVEGAWNSLVLKEKGVVRVTGALPVLVAIPLVLLAPKDIRGIR